MGRLETARRAGLGRVRRLRVFGKRVAFDAGTDGPDSRIGGTLPKRGAAPVCSWFASPSVSSFLKGLSTGSASGPRYSVRGWTRDFGIGFSFRSIVSSPRLALTSRTKGASSRWSRNIFASRAIRVAFLRSIAPASWDPPRVLGFAQVGQAAFDPIPGRQAAQVFGHHLAIFGDVFAREQGEPGYPDVVDDDGLAAVSEAVDTRVPSASFRL